MVRKNRIVVIDSGIKIYPEFPSEIITGCGIVHNDLGEIHGIHCPDRPVQDVHAAEG